MWSTRSQVCTAIACSLATLGVPVLIPPPWAWPVGILLFGMAVIFAIAAWRTRKASAVSPELLTLLEELRSDRTVIAACTDDPVNKIFTVHTVPKPRLTRAKAQRYEELADRIRAHGWRVDGTPMMVEILCGTQYPYIQHTHPGAAPETRIHLGRVCVRNPVVRAIESVEISLTDVSVAASGAVLSLVGLPANLILINDPPPFRSMFRLGGEAEQYVDLITVHLESGVMYVQHIVSGIDIKVQSSDGPFLFRVRVTGEGLSRVEQVFEVGVAARRLYLRPTQPTVV